MFRSLAQYAMRGRWQAALTASVLSLAALLLPPLNYLASGVIALATLRNGPREGAGVLLATLLIVAVAAGLMSGLFWLAAILMLASWLPVYLVTLVLGYTRSISLAMLASAGLGILTVVGFYLAIGDPAQWWQQMLEPFMTTLQSQAGWQLSASETETVFQELSVLMTGVVAAGVVFNAIVGLLLGRFWQSTLFDEGAFGREFAGFTLGKSTALVTTLLMALAITPFADSLGLLIDLLPVALVLFAFQGLAVAHSIVRSRNKSVVWLVIVYALLIFMLPQMLILLATLGVLEQWFNFRRQTQAAN
jgi:hypothetical protein